MTDGVWTALPNGGAWVDHEPVWEPADLPVNAAGDTRPGFVCVHELENGNGPCGGNVFDLSDAFGKHACVVPDAMVVTYEREARR